MTAATMILREALKKGGYEYIVQRYPVDQELLDEVDSMRGFYCHRIPIDFSILEQNLKVLKNDVNEYDTESDYTKRMIALEQATERINVMEKTILDVWDMVDEFKNDLERVGPYPCDVCGEPYMVAVGDDEKRGCSC